MAREAMAVVHPVKVALVFHQRRIAIDALAWAVGLTCGALLRYDFNLNRLEPSGLLGFVALAVILQLLVGLVSGLYLGRRRLGSFDEVVPLAATALTVTFVLLLLDLSLPGRVVPLSTPVGGGIVALAAMASVRYAIRAVDEQRRRPNTREARRLLVFGAGEAGAEIVTHMLRDPTSPYLPVAFLDDDPMKQRLRIMGVPVVGGREQMASAALDHQTEALLVAIPSAPAWLLRDLTADARRCGMDLKVLPTVAEVLEGGIAIEGIRTPTDADLLGRQQVNTDVESISQYLRGKRVLVTGAGGSIGSELCRQIIRLDPAALIMLDRDESALHRVQLSIEGRALLDSPDLVLLDLRDADGLVQLMRSRRPQVVFHAAALKHLPLLESHPAQAVHGNIWVTARLLAAAADVGVEKFVNISTDKAAEPTSVLGYSKRIGERITAHFAEHTAGAYISVRFGNVLSSNGSVLPAFRAQIASGGPVTVTHPEVSRYFMTVEEAVQLVIQAAVINGRGSDAMVDLTDGATRVGVAGEALVLDMGDPVRIDDIARRLIDQSGRDIDIVYTGLRPGEKLHEVLFGPGEHVVRRVHPLISHVRVPPLDPDAVWRLDPNRDSRRVVADIRALARSGLALPLTEGGSSNAPSAAPRLGYSHTSPEPALGLQASRGDVPRSASARVGVPGPAGGLLGTRRAPGAHSGGRPERGNRLPLYQASAKRLFDLVAASVGILLVSPVLLVVAVLVRLQLGTPVLFRQSRMGRLERSFKLVKFRTMTDERDAAGRLLPDAARLIPLGRLLRATSLDELPELWNVLRGDMSLVGPRPLPVVYLRRYTASERRRHELRPGVTGWAQIHGRNSLGWDERLNLDVWYVENRSLWLDVRILARTLVTMVRRSGIHAEGAATMPELRPSAPSPSRAPASPMPTARRRIWLSAPDLRGPEREMLLAALDSGWVAPVGPDLDAFELELAERCGVPHVVALASGTAALHLALLELGVRPGDDVLVPTATFAATANAVTYCGARPCFIDVDPATWQISPSLLRAELAERGRSGALPAAVTVVDLYGSCPDLDAIRAACDEFGVPLVEDAAEALGATFDGRPAGSFGDVGTLSFNGNKIITTSSGGALLCHDASTAERARYLASQARGPATHYEHTEVGYNYRLSNLLAAFGRGQLAALDERMGRRRAIGDCYRDAFADLPGVRFQAMDGRCRSNSWLTCITLEPGVAACSPGALHAHLEAHDIESRPLWKPMHAQPVYAANPARLDGTADRLFATGLCLPSGSGMTDSDVDRVVGTARRVLDRRRIRRPDCTPKVIAGRGEPDVAAG